MNWKIDEWDGVTKVDQFEVSEDRFEIVEILRLLVANTYSRSDLLNAIGGSSLLDVKSDGPRRLCGESPHFVATPCD